ncbi:MAG: sulfurtransferase TusA [Gammaproteobacteria bacterium]|nr:sulfurtransferase TusA [Gammaproteobacteria bacterium]MDD9895314.1 sulfurtransferase TusA [Gammaproteobacteria bacterium]MDD9960231.1 sulfurtransferase TusA [Gammaproteobacteria bacterium]
MSKDLNESNGTATAIELDARGLYCPEPVMLLHNKIRDIGAGQILRLVATDPSTTRDVPKFCMYLGHDLMSQNQEGDLYVYHIKKKQELNSPDGK